MGLRDHLAPLLRAPRISPGVGAPVSTRFETLLHQHEDERHTRIAERAKPAASPKPFRSLLPPGWTPEDVLGYPETSGFLRVTEAAKVMRVEPEEIVALVRSGILEARGTLVRPAIVSMLAVKKNLMR